MSNPLDDLISWQDWYAEGNDFCPADNNWVEPMGDWIWGTDYSGLRRYRRGRLYVVRGCDANSSRDSNSRSTTTD